MFSLIMEIDACASDRVRSKAMNKYIKTSKISTEKGQALLFVVVAMTIALTVGISISSQTISSLKQSSSTDSASRAFSAAEGGIEWFLRQGESVLENLSDGNTNNGEDCPQGSAGDNTNTACIITYEPQNNDKIQSKATITVKKFNVNYTTSPNEHYWFVVSPGSTKEVSLLNYSGNTDICWKSLETSQSSAIYYYTYNIDGIKEKKLITPVSITGSISVSGSVSASTGKLDFNSCYRINIPANTIGLRIKSLYTPSRIGIFPLGNNFSTQGYRITSVGQIDDVSQNIKATKEINVYRSYPYVSSIFDYAIYSNGVMD